MKKIIGLFVIGITIFLLIGCKNNSDNIEDNIKVEEKLGEKYSFNKWKCNIKLTNINDFSSFDNMFITNDGELYQYSFDKLFSNERYCKKIESNMKFVKFYNGAIRTTTGKFYAWYDGDFIERMPGWTGGFDYDIYDKYPDLFLFSKNYGGSHFDENFQYAVIRERDVYNIKVIKSFDKPQNYELIKIGSFSESEEFLNNNSQIILTNKNYYNYSIINKEKCNTYENIECEYGLKRVDDISNSYKDIYYFNGKMIIYKSDLNNIYFYD